MSRVVAEQVELVLASIRDEVPQVERHLASAVSRRRPMTTAPRLRRFVASRLDVIVVTLGVASLDLLHVNRWISFALGALITIVPTALFGRTAGKAAMGLKVVMHNSHRTPNVWTSALRWAVLGSSWPLAALIGRTGTAIALLVELIVLLPILWNREGRGLHDRAAGTVVVRVW